MQGLPSHISQTPKCRQALKEKVRQNLGGKSHLAASASEDTMDTNIPLSPNGAQPDVKMNCPMEADCARASERVANLHHVTVEDVEDEEPGGLPKRPWIGGYPANVAAVLGEARTVFEELLASRTAAGSDNFAPFDDRDDWELASWLVRSGLSQEMIEDYLTLPIVRVMFVHEEVFDTYSVSG